MILLRIVIAIGVIKAFIEANKKATTAMVVVAVAAVGEFCLRVIVYPSSVRASALYSYST